MTPPESAADAQDGVELVGVLADFRTALPEELDAARRVAAGAGIQLLNGQLIAHAAESYQYAFTLESVLNLPDDLPGELRIPGRRPVEATIVSLEGVSITISVPEPLGDFIPRVTLQSDLTMLLRILIERIEALSTQPNPAGESTRPQERQRGRNTRHRGRFRRCACAAATEAVNTNRSPQRSRKFEAGSRTRGREPARVAGSSGRPPGTARRLPAPRGGAPSSSRLVLRDVHQAVERSRDALGDVFPVLLDRRGHVCHCLE